MPPVFQSIGTVFALHKVKKGQTTPEPLTSVTLNLIRPLHLAGSQRRDTRGTMEGDTAIKCDLCGWISPSTEQLKYLATTFHVATRHPIEYFQTTERTLPDLLRKITDAEVMFWYVAFTKEGI